MVANSVHPPWLTTWPEVETRYRLVTDLMFVDKVKRCHNCKVLRANLHVNTQQLKEIEFIRSSFRKIELYDQWLLLMRSTIWTQTLVVFSCTWNTQCWQHFQLQCRNKGWLAKKRQALFIEESHAAKSARLPKRRWTNIARFSMISLNPAGLYTSLFHDIMWLLNTSIMKKVYLGSLKWLYIP